MASVLITLELFFKHGLVFLRYDLAEVDQVLQTIYKLLALVLD
jgi:hypothetical protein